MKHTPLWMTLLFLLGLSIAVKAQINPEPSLFTPPALEPVKIMFIGNSITKGGGVDGGFRRELFNRFFRSPYAVDFVGSQSYGEFPDAEHEGITGQRADNLMTDIYAMLEANPPQMIMLHIGTNDVNQGQPAAKIIDEVSFVLDEIDRFEQDVGQEIHVILAKVINRREPGSEKSLRTSLYNELLEEMALERISQGDLIRLIDLEPLLTYPDDLYDEIHPNCEGHKKLAPVMFEAMSQVIEEHFPQSFSIPEPLFPAEIEGFYLVNAESDTVITEIRQGEAIILQDLPTDSLSIVAYSNHLAIGSVEIELQGPTAAHRIENLRPYAAFGKTKGSNYNAAVFQPGTYKVKATPFSERWLKGNAGHAHEIIFEVVEDLDLTVQSLWLLNADNDQVIGKIHDGDTIYLEHLDTLGLSVLANTFPSSAGSVWMTLENVQKDTLVTERIEGVTPYTLFGDQGMGTLYGEVWGEGTFRVEVIPYTRSCLDGVAGKSMTLNFTLTSTPPDIIPPSPQDTLPKIEEIVLIDAAQDTLMRTLQVKDTIDLRTTPELNMLAETLRSQSVRFTLRRGDGSWLENRFENLAPFSFYGENSETDYAAWTPEPGDYILEIQSYEKKFAKGNYSDTLRFQLHLIGEEETPIEVPQDTLPVVQELFWIDVATNMPLRPVVSQDTIDMAEIPFFTFLAQTQNTQSVRFTLRTGEDKWLFHQFENLAPFSFFGEDSLGNYLPWLASTGDYILEVLPYEKRFAQGIAGDTLRFQIHVQETQPEPSSASRLERLYPNPNDQHILTVRFADPIEGELQITLMNARGEAVFRESMSLQEAQQEVTLDWREIGLTPGTYYLAVQGTQVNSSLRRVNIE